MVGSLQIVSYKASESDLYHTWASVTGSKKEKEKESSLMYLRGR